MVGSHAIVEIDESKFVKRKYHKGPKGDGVSFGMVERSVEREISLVAVDDRKAAT